MKYQEVMNLLDNTPNYTKIHHLNLEQNLG